MTTFSLPGARRTGSTLSSSPKPDPAGTLIHKDHTGKVLGRKKIYPNQQMVIGRDRERCQYVLSDPYASKRHLRIYTVVYENDEPSEVDTLVYAEDLSQNGTYWNGSFIGKGNGGFLLSDQDVLRLSSRTYLVFVGVPSSQPTETFDYIQETEMAQFRKDYVLSDRLLGAGAFGRVIMAIEQQTRRQVACKVVDLRVLMPGAQTRSGGADQPAAANDIDSRSQVRKVKEWVAQQKRKDALEKQLSKYYREVDILASICHPNIIGIEKAYVTDNTLYIMQEIVTAGDLFSYIEFKNGKLLEAEAAVIIRQLLIALSFLHSKNIVHRDIKPDNILMTSLAAGCRVILTDFGAARRVDGKLHRMSSVIGTHEYAAPEILGYMKSHFELERPGYTQAVDMWAAGCVTVVLLTGGLAFSDPVTNAYSEKLALECNLELLRKLKEWKMIRPRPMKFVEELLVLDESTRLTAEEALRHTWFYNEVHKNDFEELYQRTIKHWQPRTHKTPVLEFQDSGWIRALDCSRPFCKPPGRVNTHSQAQIEPHYKPFPRKMYQSLWPSRSPNKRLSDEVLSKLERSSPASASRLGRRVESRSTTSRPALTSFVEAGTEKLVRGLRAASAPPVTRNSPGTGRRNVMEHSTSLDASAPGMSDGVRPSGRRPASPRLQGGLSGLNFDRPPDLASMPASRISAATTSLEQTATANVVRHRRLSPGLTSHSDNAGDPTFCENEVETSTRSNVGTARSDSKLKRKPSASLAMPSVKRQRRSSVFDLAENMDQAEPGRPGKTARQSTFELTENDGEKSRRLPRLALNGRSTDAPSTETKLQPTNLHLPR